METKESHNKKATIKGVASKRAEATTAKETKAPLKVVETSKSTVEEILKPTAKGRISKLETLNILAEKHKKANAKYDELTHFIASNDGTNGQMKFSSESGYTFTINNTLIVREILTMVEGKLADIVDTTEKEVLNFNI